MLKKQKKMIRREVGITLIALIITVIVMLILAGVAINLIVGENGIFKKSDEGAQIYKNVANYEASSLNDVDNKMGELINQYQERNTDDTSTQFVTVENSKGKKFEDTTIIKDGKGEKVPIPGGFTISIDSSNEVDEGIVIVDEKGNEFVWVPVPDSTTIYGEETVTLDGGYTTTNRYSKLRGVTSAKPGSTGYREPDVLTSTEKADFNATDTSKGIAQIKNVLGIVGETDEEVLTNYSQSLVEEYSAMIDSVIKYKGFYIGRYELTGTVDNPTSKSGVVLTEQTWYSLKKACNNVIDNQYVQSCMIYGWQWDETMSWLIRSGAKTEEEVKMDSRSWGNYIDSIGEAAVNSGTKQNTGSNEAWKVNNIYDLAGNCWEWTQEAFTIVNRIFRGRIL